MHSISAKIQAHILYIHHILIITTPPPLYLTYMHNVQLTTLKCQIEENNNCQYQPKNNKSKQHTIITANNKNYTHILHHKASD